MVRIDQDRTTEICTSRPNMLTKYLKWRCNLDTRKQLRVIIGKESFLGQYGMMRRPSRTVFCLHGLEKYTRLYRDHAHRDYALIPTYVCQKERLNKQDLPVVCRACKSSEESLYHVMCNCPACPGSLQILPRRFGYTSSQSHFR